jgi:hypothetical protein
MSKRRKSKQRGKKNKNSSNQTLTIQGPWGSSLSLPIGRLPVKIGSDVTLSANNSIYPKMVKLDAKINTEQLSVAAGAAAGVLAIDTTLIANFSTRFASLFGEYCLVGANLEIRYASLTNPGGIGVLYLDEKAATAPTANAALAAAGLDVQLANVESPSRYSIKWTAKDYIDLDWTDTSTNVTSVWLKFYTNTANFGTPAAGTGVIYVTGSLAFCFRGYAG